MSKEYEVTVDWQGYSRGTSTYLVTADSEEDAIDNYYEGEKISHSIVRDDTETTDVYV